MNFYKAVRFSFEWRVIAFGIQWLVLLINGFSLTNTTVITLETQLALFLGQTLWIRTRL